MLGTRITVRSCGGTESAASNNSDDLGPPQLFVCVIRVGGLGWWGQATSLAWHSPPSWTGGDAAAGNLRMLLRMTGCWFEPDTMLLGWLYSDVTDYLQASTEHR